MGHNKAMDPVAREKISVTEPVKFRPGQALGPKLAATMATLREREPNIELSATLRDALDAFWPQINAYLVSRQQSALDAVKLVQLTCICAKALEHGVTAEQLEEQLDQLISRRLIA